MEKSLSQRIARFLEIINYFLLIPTSLIEVGALVNGLILLVNFKFDDFFFCAGITLIYVVGTLLLYGYYKHSRGEVGKIVAICLWMGTILFNCIPVVFILSLLADHGNFTGGRFWFYNIFGSYLSVILLAAVALIYDLRDEFK